jgi:hypothetical protein
MKPDFVSHLKCKLFHKRNGPCLKALELSLILTGYPEVLISCLFYEIYLNPANPFPLEVQFPNHF